MATTALPTPTPALTPIQEQVISMIAAGVSMRQVAEAADIHRNTIGNWRRGNPLFAEALATAQYDRVLYWRDAAEEHAALALYTIQDLLQDPKTPAGVRLRAALAILKDATTLPQVEPAMPVIVAEATEAQAAATQPEAPPPVPQQQPQNVHNSAQRAPTATQQPDSAAAPSTPAPPEATLNVAA